MLNWLKNLSVGWVLSICLAVALLSLVGAAVLEHRHFAAGDEKNLHLRGWDEMKTSKNGDVIVVEGTGELVGVSCPFYYGGDRGVGLGVYYTLNQDGHGYKIMYQQSYPGGWKIIGPGQSFKFPEGTTKTYEAYLAEFAQRDPTKLNQYAKW